MNTRRTLICELLFALCCSVAQVAAAQEPVDSAPGQSPAQASAQAGTFLPLTDSAQTGAHRGYVLVRGGYDWARGSIQSDARVEATLLPWLAIRGGPIYTQHPERFRPFIGVRAQALSQTDHGLDLGFGLAYQPEGFTEAEGEIELTVALGRHFGRLGTFANVVYGQDPEARERDGEVRLAALYELAAPLQAGLDARLRVDLGSEPEVRKAEGEAEWDLLVGPTLSYAAGSIATLVHAGLSAVDRAPARYGAFVLLGVAGVL